MIILVFVDTVLILCAINHGIVHFKKRFQILKRLKIEIILYFTFLTIYYHIISVMSHKDCFYNHHRYSTRFSESLEHSVVHNLPCRIGLLLGVVHGLVFDPVISIDYTV